LFLEPVFLTGRAIKGINVFSAGFVVGMLGMSGPPQCD
jgi:hypothetical protein